MEQTRIVVGQVAKSDIGELWPAMEPLLQRALDHGYNVPVKALYAGALLDQVQLWAALAGEELRGTAATQVIDYGSGLSALRVIALAGEGFNGWCPQIIAMFEAYARRVGAKTIESVGRRGWARTLRPYGFEQKYTVCTKEVA